MMKPIRLLNLMLLLAALFAGLAFAAGTSANERITNVATATYNDSTGDPQTTTSNPVTTIVQAVYNFTITPNGADENNPGQTETALPGAPVYFNYIVTNTGNTTDTINLVTTQGTETPATTFGDLTGVTIYLDAGCDGSVAGDSIVTSVTLDADEPACIIVAGTIPGTATDGQIGNINVEGTSAGNGTVTDTDNWARAEANTAGNLTGNKVASPASGTPVAASGTISYTISGSNNGGAAAYGQSVTYTQSAAAGFDAGTSTTVDGIFITDNLDDDVSYAGSLTGTAGAGTVVLLYSDDDGATWHNQVADLGAGPADGTNADVTDVAMLIQGTGAFFPQSANYSMSFNVTVNSGVTEGTPINNTATISYSTDGTDTPSTTTNTTNNPVAGAYAVRIGPEDLPEDVLGTAPNDSASYPDPASGKTWNVDLSGDGTLTPSTDTQTITNIVLTGDTVAFKHTVKNTGNATDSFDISASSASGYSVTLFQANGTSPLLGSVGPLAPGAEVDVVVKVAVSGILGDTVTVTATSDTDGTATDVSTDIIPVPVNRTVDLATFGESDDSDPTDDDPANQITTPGSTVTYPIEFTNTGNQDNEIFALSETLPVGWTVEYFPDTNCDGDAGDTGEDTALSPNTITDVDADETVCVVAVVTVPASATNDSDPGTTGFQPYDIDFTVTRVSDNSDPNNPVLDTAVTDTISTQVTVQVTDIEFINNQTATTSPDSVVTYTHTLINNGNLAGSVDFPAQPGTTAFTYQYAVDTDGDGDFSDETFTPSLSGVTVAANDTETIFVRVVVPDTAVDGDSETVAVEAREAGTTTVIDSVQDTTIVQAGELDLVKSARTCIAADCTGIGDPQSPTGATAEPNDYIEYTVVASNIGSGILTNVKVSDPLPAFTDFVSVTATSTVAGTVADDVLFSTNGTSWTDDESTLTLATGGTVYVGVDTDGDDDIDADDDLQAGETITLTFIVQVQ